MKKIILFFVATGLVFYLQVQTAGPFKLGLENIPNNFVQELKKRKIKSVGLVTNQTGIDQVGNRNIDLLLERGIPLHYIFAPEHGIKGTIAMEKEVTDTVDGKTKLPVISLYGKHTKKNFDPVVVKKIDLFIFDIQDVGMRHYTYISTLLELLKMASQNNKPVVVLDRPNPLGARMEGPLVEPELISFISAAAIPLRHGMTVGELARYFNRFVLKKPIELQVIPMQQYARSRGMHMLMAGPSPNIQSIDSCRGYSFLGLLAEVRPFDVAIATDKAFQCILLADELKFSQEKWSVLSRKLKRFGVSSQFYRYFSKRKKKHYSGLQIAIANVNAVRSFDAFIDVLLFFKNNGVKLSFSREFDKAVGTKKLRELFSRNGEMSSFKQDTKNKVRAFAQRAQSVYLYKPLPIVGPLKSRTIGSLKSRTIGPLKSRTIGPLKSRTIGPLKSRTI